MTYNFLESLYSDILLLLQDLVVKRYDLARESETLESFKAFELYYACLNGSRYFYNFETFDADILAKYMTEADVAACRRNPGLIPERFREQIVEDQSARIIETYVERNNYYRMLAGLPPVERRRFIYVTKYHDIPSDVPIHEMTDDQISRLEIRGEIARLKAEHPDDEYLDYLGVRKIDIISARLAKPFELLRLGIPANSHVREMFEAEYYGARRYVMSNFFNRSRFTNKKLHDPYIGVLMLTLAVRNTLVPTEAEYLNFEEILNAILESYGLIKYFKIFPFKFKKNLVIALDRILSVKGTDGVLLDLCRLFSFDNFTANRYYLLKTHAKDSDGNVIYSDDPEEGFELAFAKADIAEHDIDLSSENLESYEGITENDYLWQLTEEEKRDIMDDDFNLMMTKYIDVEAAYDVSALTFEVCYFINLLLQSRGNMIKIRTVNQYATGGSSDIYTMIVFLLATLSKRSGFDGNIVYEPSDIADILRFNYGDISAELREIIDKYELQVDVPVGQHLIPDYEKVELDKPVGMTNDYRMLEVYINNRSLYDAIIAEMNTTNDIRRYIALSNARDCMYISAMERKDFTKSDGTCANTYYEMLCDLDPRLAKKLDSIDMEKDDGIDNINKLLLYILEKLEELFDSPELKYLFLNTPNTYGTLISRYLRIAINAFKASSVQLHAINVVFYLGDDRPIRIIDKAAIHREFGIEEDVHIWDEVSVHRRVVIDDYVYIMDKAYTNS